MIDEEELDAELFDKLLDMLKYPDNYSEVVRVTMGQVLQTIWARIRQLEDKSILSMDISHQEFTTYFVDLFIEYGIEHLNKELIGEINEKYNSK